MPPLPRNAEFEAMLAANPDDDGACAVYGDWLQEHGSPHGELIQIQRTLHRDPRDFAMRRREADLFDRHGAALVGASLVARIPFLDWRDGFVRGAELHASQLGELLAAPAGWLVRELDVHGEQLQPAVEQLVARRPPVVGLQLHDRPPPYDDDGGATPPAVTQLAALWPALPGLERLALRGGRFALGALDVPRLGALVLAPEVLTLDALHALASATRPGLTRLELWLERLADQWEPHDPWGGEPARSAIDLADLRGMFEATPALTQLTIGNTTLGDALCEAILHAPFAGQLRHLTLTAGTITDAGAALLARHRGRLPRLERVDLDGNRIASEAAIAGLPRAPHRMWTQYPPGRSRDHRRIWL